jgi:sulfite oxidase
MICKNGLSRGGNRRESIGRKASTLRIVGGQFADYDRRWAECASSPGSIDSRLELPMPTAKSMTPENFSIPPHDLPAWSRRQFLRSVAAASLVFRFGSSNSRLLRAGDETGLPGGKRLIVRSAKPLNAEPALDRLVEDWITPHESFYVRNHGELPTVDARALRISVEGLVDKPQKFSIAELQERFPAVEVTATLTCAGNRRNEFTGPKIGGVQWGAGAIGNARWGGISLDALLKHVGVQAGARHVWFEGADRIVDKSETYPFGGSIPIDKALGATKSKPGPLLALKMNGETLAPEHGFPIRAVVAGYIGARSVKWLSRIVVSDRPSPNHYLAQAYKLIQEETPAALDAANPLYDFALNSVICAPASETAVQPGKLKVRGFALPGGASGRRITKIELSVDGGERWTAARATPGESNPYCWVLWEGEVDVTAGTARLLVRATDSSGEMQPREMPWNFKGYQYNAWHQVRLQPA